MITEQKEKDQDEIIYDFNHRSEEVLDIIDRMPVGWTRIVVVIIMVVILVIIALGFIIKYPDTVSGQISITGEKAPVRMISLTSGRLHLLVENNTEVKKGTCLGYLETGAVYEDIIKLNIICSETLREDTRMALPDNLELGAISTYYNDFVLAYNQYDQLRRTKVYDNMRQRLRTQRLSDQKLSENLQKEIYLNNLVLNNLDEQHCADSVLYHSGALSEEYMTKQYNTILSSRQSNIELKSTELAKQSEISSIDIELAKVDINVREELAATFRTMATTYNNLINQIRQWKEHYLFIAPISGTLQYQQFLRNDMFVNTSSELFSISPVRNRMIGELLIPTRGAGKVKVGQNVNIKLADYPYDEYGYIRGKVKSMSNLTHIMDTPNGAVKAYLVTVSFPDGMKTNFGKQLPLNFESVGVGEVITEKRQLIQRLFDNLKAKETK